METAMRIALLPALPAALPPVMLRLEGGVALAAAVWAYHLLGGGWAMFALLFLLPDVSMLGYLRDPKLGAWVYNLGHTTLAPALLAVVWWGGQGSLMALIWLAHIGFDRLLGYGLKYADDFHHTHLGDVRTG